MILILITVMVFGIGCGSNIKTLEYHQWVPVQITQQQPTQQQVEHQHLKK